MTTTIHGLNWNIQRATVTQPDRDTPPEGGEIESVSFESIESLADFCDWVLDDEKRSASFRDFLTTGLRGVVGEAFEGWARGAMDTEIEESEGDSE